MVLTTVIFMAATVTPTETCRYIPQVKTLEIPSSMFVEYEREDFVIRFRKVNRNNTLLGKKHAETVLRNKIEKKVRNHREHECRSKYRTQKRKCAA